MPTAPLPGAGLRKTVIRAFGFTGAVFALDRMIQVAILAILARLLTPTEFGVVAAASLVVSLMGQLSQMGLLTVMIQDRDLTPAKMAVVRTIILSAAAVLFVAALLGAPLASLWFRNDDVTGVVRFMAVMILAFGIVGIPHATLIRDLRARDIAILDLVCGVIGNGLIAVPMALNGWGYWSLAAGAMSQHLLRTLAVVIITRLPFTFGFELATARRLMTLGVGYILTTFLHRAATEGDRLIIGRTLTAGDLGLYSRANGLMAFPAAFYGALVDRIAFPAFSKVQDHARRMKEGYGHALSITAVIGIPLTVAMIAFGDKIVLVILGQAWAPAIAPFQVLSIACYLRLADRVNASLLRSVGRPFWMARLQAVVVVTTLIGCTFAVRYGIVGVAAAVTGAAALSYILLTTASVRIAGLSFIDFLRSQMHGAASGLLTALASAVAVVAAAALQAGPLVSLLLGVGIVGGAALAGVLAAPSLFLGPDMRQALTTAAGIIGLKWIPGSIRS